MATSRAPTADAHSCSSTCERHVSDAPLTFVAMAPSPLNLLSESDYNLTLWQPEYWRPYVHEVWRRHGLPGGDEIRPCPGTNAVFFVDGRFAVKFFSSFAGTIESFLAERDVYSLAGRPGTDLPVPTLIADGRLVAEGWPWPYIVTNILAGTPFDEVRPETRFEDRLAQADFLGRTLRSLHDVRVNGCVHLQPSWDWFLAFLARQRTICVANHLEWGMLPDHLQAQIAGYLPDREALCDITAPPRLLHADVVSRHVLGTFENGRWQATSLIDFGDARVGDPLYDLAAVHIGVFRCDKRLLRAFLASYGWPSSRGERFVRRCMSYTLLHEFYIERPTFPGLPPRTASLDELASLVWDVDAPGLPDSEW
jgi:aminoglycoside phosphotransferase (APT) family kinase protein